MSTIPLLTQRIPQYITNIAIISSFKETMIFPR